MPAEVRPAAARADDHVGLLLARRRQLLLGLQADHRLVQEDVVEHRPEGVVGVGPAGGVGHRVADGGAERAGRRRVGHRRRLHLAAPRLDHHPPVGLLLERRAHHVDLALQVEEGAGEGQGAPPLAGAGLGGQAGGAVLLVVEGLGDGGVGLVRPRRRHRLVLVVDPGRGAEEGFEAAGPHEGRRPPHAEDVEDLARDVDPRLGGDLLADEGHREQGGQVVGADGLAGAGVERGLQRRGDVGGDVEPRRRDAVGREEPAAGAGNGRVGDGHAVSPRRVRRAAAGSGAVTNCSPTRMAS